MRGNRSWGARRGRGKRATGLRRLLEELEPRVLLTGLYSQWPTDALANSSFFPIGVWYQSPNPSYNNEINGYAAMHINTFVYLDSSTTTTVLNDIAAAHMYAIMEYSPSLANNSTIIAWYNPPDEPDNAQPNGSGGYGDPVLPAVQIGQYNTIKSENSARPVFEGFGQGVAWAYYGRGSRTGDFQDYPYQTSFKWTNGQTYTQGYLASTDIGAFDVYPMNSTSAGVGGNLGIVGTGVKNLVNWSKPGAPVWNTLETTQITAGQGSAPTPAQVKAEVWISLVNGSDGIIYFAHTISPFVEDALLVSPTMNPAVTAINAQIESLAPVLNSATQASGTITTGYSSNVHVQFMTKSYNGDGYLFAVADQNSNGVAVFRDPAMAGVNGTVEVIGENRTLPMYNGVFQDTFGVSGVHLYQILGQAGFAPVLTAVAVPGDANGDGVVNFADFAIMSNNFGTSTTAGPGAGDFNGDGIVNSADFTILNGNFGMSAAAPQVVVTASPAVGTDVGSGTERSWHKARGQGHPRGGSGVKLEAPGPDVMALTLLHDARRPR